MELGDGLGGQDRLWRAREVCRAMTRVLDGSRRASTPAPAEPRGDVGKALRGFVRRYGRFTLRAGARGLSLGAEPIPDEQGRFAALGAELLVGGVRELSVEKGVTDDEVERLLEALGGEPAPDDLDLATRVLEAGLEHVEVTSLEFVPTLDRPEASGGAVGAAGKLQELQKQADALVKELQAKGTLAEGPVIYELSDSGGELRRLERVRGGPLPPPDDDDEPLIAVPPAAVVALRARVLEASRPDAVLPEVVDSVLQGLALDPQAVGPDNARWFLELAPEVALQEGNISLLAAIVERYAAELTLSDGPVAAAAKAALDGLGSEKGIGRVVAAATSADDPAALVAVLGALDEGVPAALAIHQRAAQKELKDALAEFLGEAIAGRPAALRPLLAPESSVEAAKFALFLVSRGLEPAAADPLYDLGRKHPQQAVADYAAFLQRTQTPKGRLMALVESLEKDDVQLRIDAVSALARARDQGALDTLVKLVHDPSFLGRTPEEMQAFLEAIAEIGGPQMLKFFEEQAGRSSGLFKLRAGGTLRHSAKELMARLAEEAEADAREGGGA